MKTIKTKNSKSYTKKQICEAIQYWKNILENEDNNDISELMDIAKKISPETAKLAQSVQDMQNDNINESVGKAALAIVGALMVAVAVMKQCANKVETPLEKAAAMMEGKTQVKSLEEKYKILNQAIDQIGDLTSGMAGDVIQKWGDGKVSKADADLTLSKLGRVKTKLKAEKAKVSQELFNKIMNKS